MTYSQAYVYNYNTDRLSILPVLEGGLRSFDPDVTIVSYEWDFGDLTSSNAINPSHSYTEPGKYLVTLSVPDNLGLSSIMAQLDITVRKSGGKK